VIGLAALVLKDAVVIYNGVDLSDHVRSVEIPADVDSQDVTAMSANTKHSLPGLKDSQVKITFLQDYAAGKVDATFWPDYNLGTCRTLVIKPASAIASSTNPLYVFTGFISAYSPIKGKVGDAAEVDATFTISSGDLYRFIAPIDNFTVTPITTNRASATLNAGAVTAAQEVIAVMYVTSVAGTNPTLDMLVKSGVTDWGTPTTRLTFSQVTTTGSTTAAVQRLAGPVTDQYWQTAATVSGAGATFYGMVLLLIQAK